MHRRKVIKLGIGVISFSVLYGTVKGWFRTGEPVDVCFLEQQTNLLAELAETIIPETDTPGAKLAGVTDYLLLVIRDCFSERDRRTFLNGLELVDREANKRFNKAFVQCSFFDREQVLIALEGEQDFLKGVLGKIKRKLWGRSFMEILKEHVVKGYCTSELGATRGLAYEAIPIQYEACIPLRPGQKAWATY